MKEIWEINERIQNWTIISNKEIIQGAQLELLEECYINVNK